MRLTGRIDIRATALEPIVHGAGTSGNTSLMRVQQVRLPDGSLTNVPYISGNSVKHKLRAAAVQYALDALGVEDGTLTKAEVDLLFSGGHLSKSGAAVDLELARQLETLFPPLSLCGYSAGNTMTESKLRVSHLHLVCAENAWRVPDDLADHPALKTRGAALRTEDFGTRHDQASKHAGVRYLTGEVQQSIAKSKRKRLGDDTPSERGDSAQMIYEFQSISAGSTLWGDVRFADLTQMERAALSSSFHYAAADRRGDSIVLGVGAKNSIGYGSIKVELRGSLRVAAPQYVAEQALATEGDSLGAEYTRHLRERKDEILATVRRAVS